MGCVTAKCRQGYWCIKNRSGQERGDPRIIPPLRNRPLVSTNKRFGDQVLPPPPKLKNEWFVSLHFLCLEVLSPFPDHKEFICFFFVQSWPEGLPPQDWDQQEDLQDGSRLQAPRWQARQEQRFYWVSTVPHTDGHYLFCYDELLSCSFEHFLRSVFMKIKSTALPDQKDIYLDCNINYRSYSNLLVGTTWLTNLSILWAVSPTTERWSRTTWWLRAPVSVIRRGSSPSER